MISIGAYPPRSSKLHGRWSSAAGSGTGCVRALPEETLRATITRSWSEEDREVMLMGGSAGSEGVGAPWASK